MQILIILFLINQYSIVLAIDVFCGKLDVFNEQRFGQGSITISSQVTADLKQCLNICCSIPNCEGVTFEGISSEFDDSNCLLVSCDPICQLNSPNKYSSGVLSVIIQREKNETEINKLSTSTFLNNLSSESTTTTATSESVKTSGTTPFWVLAVAICVASVCIGLNVTLCVAYCCYCRRKKRSQKAHISTVKNGPTLHAFNPTI